MLNKQIQFFKNLYHYFFKSNDEEIEKQLKVEQTKIMQESLKNPDNPHLYGYATYIALYADQEDKATYYKNINRVLLVLVLFFAIAFGMVSCSSKVQPYVVGINQNGEVFNMNESITTIDDAKLRPKLAQNYIRNFIKDTFSVSIDGDVQRNYQSTAYAMSKGAALDSLRQYYEQNNPYKTAQNHVVSTDIIYILPLSDHTVRASWIETTKDVKTSKVVTKKTFTGEFTYKWDVHSTESLVQKFNPLGFYIDSITWSEDNT